MEIKLVTNEELSRVEHPLPDNVQLVAFKIVAFGPNTLAEAEYRGSKICEITEKQPGFFIISDCRVAVRTAMHELVDRFCDKLP